MSKKISVSTPGRVCLFGEHQDYLGLPVIAAAVSVRIGIEGEHQDDLSVNINLPDIKGNKFFRIDGDVNYTEERDYFKSSFNVVKRHGFTFSKGLKGEVRGTIPINAGTSSSSALIVSWINFLARMSDQERILDSKEIARLAHEAEVLEFNEPGGMMDHYSTAVGNIIYLESVPAVKLCAINADLGAFVLGNSNQPKDTTGILKRVKYGVLDIVELLKKQDTAFSLQTVNYDEMNKYSSYLDEDQLGLIRGTVRNRDILREAKTVLLKENIDRKKTGGLMNEHHSILSGICKISTEKIDSMVKAALDAGAYGAKINGSGGGGCMFAYAPENTEKVFNAIKKISDACIVNISEGTRADSGEAIGE
jgi:galactokinase